MLEIMKKLATLLITLTFILGGCSTIGDSSTISRYELLGGNPKVETIKNTIGMTLEELEHTLGTPNGTDSCSISYRSKGRDMEAHGKSFLWKHKFASGRSGRLSTILVCTLDGIVVRDHRFGFQFVLDERELTYDGLIVDRLLVRTIMENLLKSEKTKTLPCISNECLEI